MFFGRLGAGDVIGRSRVGPDNERLAMPARPPKDVGAKGLNGARFTGESGEEDGEGSERSDESVQDTVVVGDDSADSAVDVLSLCLCTDSEDRAPGLSPGCESRGSFVSSMTILGSTTVTEFDGSKSPLSTSKTDINEGI